MAEPAGCPPAPSTFEPSFREALGLISLAERCQYDGRVRIPREEAGFAASLAAADLHQVLERSRTLALAEPDHRAAKEDGRERQVVWHLASHSAELELALRLIQLATLDQRLSDPRDG